MAGTSSILVRVWDQRPGIYRSRISQRYYRALLREGLTRRGIDLYLRAIDETVDRGLRRRILDAVN